MCLHFGARIETCCTSIDQARAGAVRGDPQSRPHLERARVDIQHRLDECLCILCNRHAVAGTEPAPLNTTASGEYLVHFVFYACLCYCVDRWPMLGFRCTFLLGFLSLRLRA